MSVYTSNQMVTFHLVFTVMFWLLWVWIYIPRKCRETVLHYTKNTGYFICSLVTGVGKLAISYPRKYGESAVQCLWKWSNHLLLYPVERGETFIQYLWWLWGRMVSGKLIMQFMKKIYEKLRQLTGVLWWRICAPDIVTLNSVWPLIKVVSVLNSTLL